MADPTLATDAAGFDWGFAFGTLAAALTTGSFLPQVWHTIKTRDTRAISLSMYLLFTLGVAGWLFYGFLLASWPMVISNIVCLSLALIVLGLKVRMG